MERQTKARGPFRALVTRTINDIDRELANENPDKKVLSNLAERLQVNAVKVAACDTKVYEAMLDEDKNEDELAAEVEAVEQVEERVRLKMNQITDLINPAGTSSSQETAGGTVVRTTDDSKRQYRLPKIEMKKFNGDCKNWLGFWAQFEKIHLDKSLHDSDKFQYLAQQMVHGSRAKELLDSYPQTAENYPKVIEALKERFGKEKMLMQVYVRELLKMVIDNYTCKEKIKVSRMFDKLESHLRALESLKVSTEQMVVFLYPMVESSLPEDVLIAWQRSPLYGCDGSKLAPPKSELDFLMEFLKKEVENEDQRQLVQAGFVDHTPKEKKIDKRGEHQFQTHFKQKKKNRASDDDIPTAAGLHISEKKTRSCTFCEKSHPSHECFQTVDLPLEEKQAIIKKSNACRVCLRTGHYGKDCKVFVKCTGCGGKHYHIMCPENPKNKKAGEVLETRANHSNQVLARKKLVLLQTLRVKSASHPSLKLRVMLDDGSQRSYIRSSLANKLKCKTLRTFMERNVVFGGAASEPERKTEFLVPLKSLDGKTRQDLNLTNADTITGRIPTVPEGPWIDNLKERGIQLSDAGTEEDEIDILIGLDLLNRVITGKVIRLSPDLVAKETVFGWTLGGVVPAIGEESVSMAVTSLSLSEASCSQLWELETLGIKDPAEHKSKTEKEAEVKNHFLQTVQRKPDGRYVVALPWTGGAQKIPNNKAVAEKRLMSTTTKLKKDGMFQTYAKIFEAWETEGFIEEVKIDEAPNCHYIPHRAVYKPESRTTPVRPVFDASCKLGRNPSLNDCLEKGPNYIELIPSVMLRFREGKIGVLSDIRKAFQMIEVRDSDCDYLRFLWWENEDCKKLKVFRHKRVVFGVSCSPFLLGAVIEHLLSNVSESDSEVAQKLLRSLYVDNCVTSVETMEEYEFFKTHSTEIMFRAQMELREWEFSAEETSGVGLSTSDRRGLEVVSNNLTPTVTSVLGMKWDKIGDFLKCDKVPEIPEKLTKRTLLSTVQQIYDPMGFLSPVMVVPKLILQEAWAQELGWDEDLPKEVCVKFGKWAGELKCLEEVHIPRSMNDGMTSREHYELHMFSDASKYAYGAVIFLRVVNGEKISVQLLQAKARVAPLKAPSIPRLELLSCTIGARLCGSVKEALNLEVPTYYWSDSTTALAWIKRNDEWGTFVGNRVREICRLTDPDDWRHVPGIYNPADLPSRGCTPEELLASRWWEGPKWLRLPQEQWPIGEAKVDEDVVLAERKKTVTLHQASEEEEEPWYAKWSSYFTCVRVLAYVRRVFKRSSSKPKTIKLSIQEIESAELVLFELIQKETFSEPAEVICGLKVVMKDNLYRVVTKVTNRQDTLDFRAPVLLPHSHPVVERLIIDEHRRSGHGGVQFLMSKLREKVWIIKSRKAIRAVVRRCVRCRRHGEKAPEVPVAPLPENRVKNARVFEVTGIDLAGPLHLKDKSKVWIVLFTCAVYRGIHLELVSSLNTDSFLLALLRFICRRGRPSIIYSDNGTNFVGAVNLFLQMNWTRIERETQQQRIRWIFNPPSAAWWGGWWERLVRTVKDLLKKMLGHSKLGYVQLETCLVEVEAVVNARPLTYVTEDQDDLVPLTPAMFMQDNGDTRSPEVQALNTEGFRRKYKELLTLKLELKERFRIEYLGLLVHRGNKKNTREFSVGEVVLIASDNKKRLQWPMAKILELLPGRDGQVRVARVKTANGEMVRPLQRLIPLEVQEDSPFPIISPEVKIRVKKSKEEEKKPEEVEVKPEVITRAGRRVKTPVRF